MGIEQEELEGVEEVVIRTANKEYVIRDPNVTAMTARVRRSGRSWRAHRPGSSRCEESLMRARDRRSRKRTSNSSPRRPASPKRKRAKHSKSAAASPRSDHPLDEPMNIERPIDPRVGRGRWDRAVLILTSINFLHSPRSHERTLRGDLESWRLGVFRGPHFRPWSLAPLHLRPLSKTKAARLEPRRARPSEGPRRGSLPPTTRPRDRECDIIAATTTTTTMRL